MWTYLRKLLGLPKKRTPIVKIVTPLICKHEYIPFFSGHGKLFFYYCRICREIDESTITEDYYRLNEYARLNKEKGYK